MFRSSHYTLLDAHATNKYLKHPRSNKCNYQLLGNLKVAFVTNCAIMLIIGLGIQGGVMKQSEIHIIGISGLGRKCNLLDELLSTSYQRYVASGVQIPVVYVPVNKPFSIVSVLCRLVDEYLVTTHEVIKLGEGTCGKRRG